MFSAQQNERSVQFVNNYVVINSVDEVLTTQGWKFAEQLCVGDILQINDGNMPIKNICVTGNVYTIYI